MIIKFKVFGHCIATIEVEYDFVPDVTKPVNALIKGVSRKWAERMW
jgi:hypothetical protein